MPNPLPIKSNLVSQAAKDACAVGYGSEKYWAYLDTTASERAKYFRERGQHAEAEKQMTQSLSESLMGNEGA